MWTTAPVQQLIASLEGFAPGLSPSLDTSSVAYGSALQVARSLISKLNTSPAALQSLGVARCITLIFKLQNLAYADHDSGGQHDIALWCERHWATIIHCDPQNLSALQGLGHAWLLKSQKVLARIHANEENTPVQSTQNRAARTASTLHSADATRINSSEYVEARALLQVSTETFDRAVSSGTNGKILELAAEAHMSYASVLHPDRNETSYQRALSYLKRASEIPGYGMDPYLKEFLEDNLEYMT